MQAWRHILYIRIAQLRMETTWCMLHYCLMFLDGISKRNFVADVFMVIVGSVNLALLQCSCRDLSMLRLQSLSVNIHWVMRGGLIWWSIGYRRREICESLRISQQLRFIHTRSYPTDATSTAPSNHYRQQHDERALSGYGWRPTGDASVRERQAARRQLLAQLGRVTVGVDSTTNGIRSEPSSDTAANVLMVVWWPPYSDECCRTWCSM